MKRTKYLLVAKFSETENEAHLHMQGQLKNQLPHLTLHSSAIGPHITICQPSLVHADKVHELHNKLAHYLYRIETLHIVLTGWNFFNDEKTGIKTIYRTLDTNQMVYHRLRQAQEIALQYMQPIGILHPHTHFHQTLGSIRCGRDAFRKLRHVINQVVMQDYFPKSSPIESFILYRKKPQQTDWETMHIMRHVPRS